MHRYIHTHTDTHTYVLWRKGKELGVLMGVNVNLNLIVRECLTVKETFG